MGLSMRGSYSRGGTKSIGTSIKTSVAISVNCFHQDTGKCFLSIKDFVSEKSSGKLGYR